MQESQATNTVQTAKPGKNAQYNITGREDVTKAGIPHQSGHDTCGFDITVSGTKDVETLYIRAITKDNKVVNFFALTTGDAASRHGTFHWYFGSCYSFYSRYETER